MNHYQFTVKAWKTFYVQAPDLESARDLAMEECNPPIGWEHDETIEDNNEQPVSAEKLARNRDYEVIKWQEPT